GLEFAYGIPGSVGGAMYMNAGAYGGEMKDVALSVTALTPDGEIREVPAEELALGYRTSIFKTNGDIILFAKYKLAQGDPAAIKEKMDDVMNRRKTKQPLEYPSAGSVFKRPENGYASALIDQCGLKGMSVGGAQVSEKHAGFVINTGAATCNDVIQLCDKVKAVVKEKTGITLELEPVVLK
ncbi:MAG: UDP-N-acetylmuramate dehydrogenase, partial [Ruminococcus sp.]|nr:UDP-N-acetylmuramate dehydrogenase [Ruminococcus sp.]